MKQYSPFFNKRSRLLKTPELAYASGDSALAAFEPDRLIDKLKSLLQVQNDFFPCFDWSFPPPLLNKSAPPASACELFSEPSVTPGRFSLYLHSPFCKTLCSFCYYAIIPGRGIVQAEQYIDYLVKEMALYRDALAGQVCESVYFGGGTPSFLDNALLVRIFEAIRRNFSLDASAEITVEAAPGTLPPDKVSLLRELGVTRLSYGIQTLDEQLLAGMNRHYSVQEAVYELEHAVAGIGNINVDTMYGFAGEPDDALYKTLSTFHSLGIPSLSIYALDTQRTVHKDVLLPPKDGQYANKIRQFTHAESLLHDFGYRAVLQNVFVQPERGSYHHQLRRWDNLPLVALGINSQGYAPRRAYQNVASLKSYFELIDADRIPVATMEELTPELEFCRELTSKLRFTFVSRNDLMHKYGIDIAEVFGDLIDALGELGYLSHDQDVLRMTPAAAYYNNIIPMLFAPDSFKELLLELPEEYLETFPVPYIMTQLGRAQSAPMHFGEHAHGERRAYFDRRARGRRCEVAEVDAERRNSDERRASKTRRRTDHYRRWLASQH